MMGDRITHDWRRWLWPLRSRKVQVAVATIIAAYGAQAGFAVGEETVVTVLGVGVALILGIAHEDAGARRSAAVHPEHDARSDRRG